jgi:hypothetical protein
MNRVLVDVPHGAIGFDTDTTLSAAQYRECYALGFRFAIRYLGDLTSDEVDAALASNMLLGVVQHAHLPGWTVTPLLGQADGRRAVVDANAAGLPPMPIFIDLEEPAPETTINDLHEYSYECCKIVRGAGHEAGVYWGAGLPGDAQGVYHLAFTRYWKSFSNVITPWRRGYQLLQLFHFPKGECLVRDVFPEASPLVANVAIDVDVALSDYQGSRPRMLAAG